MIPVEILLEGKESSILIQDPEPADINELLTAVETTWLIISPGVLDHLSNPFHIEFLHFTVKEGILHNTKKDSHGIHT